ncbi:MAG: TraB/GumN family protein [Planctomycetota bacterium]|jgi:pheromone shutdown-related protein TraB
MNEEEAKFTESVNCIKVGDKEVYIVGTAHVSQKSVEDVRQTVESVRPDSICVELCQSRYKALTQKDSWEKMNVFKVIREKKAVFLLAQLIMTSFYRRLGEKLGIQPGAEMLEAVKLANNTGTSLVLADRSIEVTLKRVWRYLGFYDKLKLFTSIFMGLFETEEVDEELIEKIKKQDQLESMMMEFAGKFPEIKKRLLDERDIYLSQKIAQAPGRKVVAVVGAGHVRGIKENINEVHSLEPLNEIPPKSGFGTVLKWAIPVLIIVLLMSGFFKAGAEHSMQSIYIWFIVNGTLSALGAAIALGHPLTIAASFLAAPLTSLNPFIAAGWVAGLVQAWVGKPVVADFEELPEAIKTVKGFWSNPVTKILLVVALANLGSVLGTFISGSWIAARTL